MQNKREVEVDNKTYPLSQYVSVMDKDFSRNTHPVLTFQQKFSLLLLLIIIMMRNDVSGILMHDE